MGTIFYKVLFWGAVVAIPVNLCIFGVGYHLDDLSLQLWPIFNIALLSTQFLKGGEKQ